MSKNLADLPTISLSRKMSAAAICRLKGWGVGTRLIGDEGNGPTVIEITAIGERMLVAKALSHDGIPERLPRENSWTLSCRDWAVTA